MRAGLFFERLSLGGATAIALPNESRFNLLPMNEDYKKPFKVRDMRIKEKWFQDDAYLNGYAKHCGWKATICYDSLCRHANKGQESFPSIERMGEEHGVSRNTIARGIKTLTEWNVIKKNQKQSKSGQFLYNTYVLVDKSGWKPSPCTGLRHRHPVQDTPSPCGGVYRNPVVSTKVLYSKDTHRRIESELSPEEKKNKTDKEIRSIREKFGWK